MSKPYPIIHLPTWSEQERLVRALYRMGYRYGHMVSLTEDRTWLTWRLPLKEMEPYHAYVLIHQDYYLSATHLRSNYSTHTLVNSIPYFLAYTRSLDAALAP